MNPVASLALATLAFVGTHLLMSHPLRAGLVARLGERGFAGLYSLVSFVTLGWMVWAGLAVGDQPPMWIAPFPWGWYAASGVMLIASILLIGSLIRNPAFPNPGPRPREIPSPKGVFAITRHPMNWSVMLWALVHLLVWGSERNLIIAGGIFFLALVGSIGQDRKKEKWLGNVWRDYEAKTSFIPFAALISGRALWRNAIPGWIALVGGFILWALVTHFHAPLVSPFGGIPPGIN